MGGAPSRRAGRIRGGELVQRRDLARPERTPREALPGPQPRGRGLARGRDPQAALISRPDGRPEQGPGQVDEALVGERAEPPQQARPALRGREVAHGTGPAGQLVEEVEVDGAEARVGPAEAGLSGRRDLGDQLEPFEHPRRQHRPDHGRQRGEVAVRDRRREAQRERRQQRTVAADLRRDRPELRATRDDGRARPDDDPDGLPPAAAERDEHRLARLEGAERRRHRVGVRPRARAGRGVDRHLDERVAAVPSDRKRERRGHGRVRRA